MQTLVGRVPVRLDLAGGTIDLWPIYLTLREAVTVNVALDLPASVRVTRTEGPAVHLAHSGTGARATLASADPDVALDDSLRLLLRAVAAVAPEGGVDVTATSTSPQGAGLGGSSALLACAVATIAQAVGRPLDREATRRLAQDVETAIVRAPTGFQDYYSSLFGGCLALAGRVGGVDVERLPVDLAALERRIRLVYTGAPHRSGFTNWSMMRAYFDEEPATVSALREIADVARATRDALRRGDLDEALRLVVLEGSVRRRIAPGVATPQIDALDHAARAAGALGTKILGAGGGGCVLVVLPGDREPAGLSSAFEVAGGRPIAVRLPAEGLVIREERDAALAGCEARR